MRVAIVCPAAAGSHLGNRITALRWQRMLRGLGHQATIVAPDEEVACDALIALHARRSAEAVRRTRQRHPERPIAVALTGTDLYRDIHADRSAQLSLEIADWLVVLHGAAPRSLPARHRRKALLVPQSAVARRIAPHPRVRTFDVAVVGHLRPEKDPLRTALAARLLPPSSRIRVLHAGRALDAAAHRAAIQEERLNPRYRWLGELSPAAARGLIARSRLMALTSLMEGGANVLSEALAAGTPVLASRIDCTRALLGADYPGLFPTGNTRALAGLLLRVEDDADFLRELRQRCRSRRTLVAPAAERRALAALVAELARAGRTRRTTH